MAAEGLEWFGTLVVGIVILTMALVGTRVMTEGAVVTIGLSIVLLFVIANLIALIYGIATSRSSVEG